jgi:hypothetical protein
MIMGTFAFRDETRRRVISALANLRPFTSGRGGNDEGLVGLSGPYRKLTNIKYGALPERYARKGRLDEAMYVVYCYGTPIAWVVMDDEANETGRINFMPDWQYSATTTYYQGLVFQSWDGIVDPDQELSRKENRGTERGRASDVRYGRVTAEQAEAAREARENRPVSPRTAFRDDAHHFRPRRASMVGNNLPQGADARDAARVLSDIGKVLADNSRSYPAHP